MKKNILTIGLAGCFLAGVALQTTHGITAGAETVPVDGFFTDTAAKSAYGDLLSAPSYQGEGGKYLMWQSETKSGSMYRSGTDWTSDAGQNSATVEEGFKYTPKAKSAVWEWKALHGGVAAFSGMIYNFYAFLSDEDLTAYGVAARSTEGTDASRDGVTVSVVYQPIAGDSEVLYRNALDSDFCMFADETSYRVAEGDKIRIIIDSGNDTSYDTVCMYMGVTLDEQVAAFDFTDQADYADQFVTDLTGKGNNLFAKSEFEPIVDEGKGLRLDGNENSFLYDLNHNSRDFTDDLTDFSIRLTFTIGSGNNDWKYIFSTTSHEDDMSTRGLALGLNSLGSKDDAGKDKYALQIRIDEAGAKGFFDVSNGWTNDLVEGGTYDVVINVSTTERKVETFTSGAYMNGWNGTNASGSSAMAVDENWTMDNPNAHGLVIGAFNEAGENRFTGWISRFEINNYYVTYENNPTGNGPFRASELTTAYVESVQPAEDIAYAANENDFLASAPETVTLNMQGGETVEAKAVWTDVMYDGSEYYLLGKVRDDGFRANSLTVKAPVRAYVAQLINEEEYVGYLACAADGQSQFTFPAEYPFLGGGYDVSWYTDSAKQTAYTGGTVTANTVLYADAKAHVYSVTYELNGGTNNAQNPAQYTVLDDSIALADPTREGYLFKGWYKESNFQTKLTAISPALKEDITVYAKWEEKPQVNPNPSEPPSEDKPEGENPEGDKKEGGNTGVYIAIGVGAAVFVAGGAVLTVALIKRKNNKNK